MLIRMFIREKRIGAYTYVYLVETVRENGKIKQRIIRNLGRKEAVEAAGDLDRLARSAARLLSARWFCPQLRAALLRTSPVGALAHRCCLNGCGRRAAAARCSRACWPNAASN